MALHSKWSSGDLIFYDGTQDIFRIKDDTDGIVVGTSGAGVPFQFHGEVTYPDPATTVTTGSTGALTLTTTSNRIQFVSSSGAGQNVIVTLPAIVDCAGIEFKIINNSTGGDVTLNDTGDNAIAVVSNDEMGILVCDGATWAAMVGGPST